MIMGRVELGDPGDDTHDGRFMCSVITEQHEM